MGRPSLASSDLQWMRHCCSGPPISIASAPGPEFPSSHWSAFCPRVWRWEWFFSEFDPPSTPSGPGWLWEGSRSESISSSAGSSCLTASTGRRFSPPWFILAVSERLKWLWHLSIQMSMSNNMFSPLVSVITPTFNHERYIGPCIESVLKQTYQNWEQIIIDDGSADATAEMVHGFADRRIRYVHQQNRGAFQLAHTYNRALNLAKGEFIAILEGDDFWPQNKLSTLVAPLVVPEIVLAYGEAADVNAQGNEQLKLSHTARLRRALPQQSSWIRHSLYVAITGNCPCGSLDGCDPASRAGRNRRIPICGRPSPDRLSDVLGA